MSDEKGMIALNVTSQLLLAKHVVRAMAERRQGRILITSSLSATRPTPYESIYGPTRAFMHSSAQGLREELNDYRVLVTALLPAVSATQFHHPAGMGNTMLIQRLKQRSEARRSLWTRRLVRRQGSRHRW